MHFFNSSQYLSSLLQRAAWATTHLHRSSTPVPHHPDRDPASDPPEAGQTPHRPYTSNPRRRPVSWGASSARRASTPARAMWRILKFYQVLEQFTWLFLCLFCELEVDLLWQIRKAVNERTQCDLIGDVA